MATRRSVGRPRREGLARTLVVTVGLALFVVAVYVVVVRGLGAAVGRTDSPSMFLSVLATATVALLFARVQARLERVATRLGQTRTPTPYDVLGRFSQPMTGEDPAEDLPARMARLLAQGTGAQWAQVWLVVSGRLSLAATWPSSADLERTPPDPRPGARDATGEARRALAVAHGRETLGVLRLQERPGLPLSTVEERLFTALADQAGLMLRLEGVRAELEGRRHELAERATELDASRQRLIETQDAERRRLERDLHDGAQQHLVALAVNLRLAQTVATTSPERARDLLARQAEAARVAIETMSSLSHGIYPRLLSQQGLVPALQSAVATSAVPVTVGSGEMEQLSPAVEAALYFCCMEAVQNAAKHSGASSVEVQLSQERGEARLVITDNGTGFAPGSVSWAGAGLDNMRDRMDAVGGAVTVSSLVGTGTTVTATVNARAA